MKTKIVLGLLFVLVLSVILTSCSVNPEPDVNYDTLAQCLTDKSATMYGTDWCSHCQNQKKAFGDSFELINYVNCDKQRDECILAGVKGYPTWGINGELYPGEQSLGRLTSIAGCELPTEV